MFKAGKVLVTGHTGFKGSWLCAWLLSLDAEVTGYSFDVPTQPANFEILALARRMDHVQGDVRNKTSLQKTLKKIQPEIVFHLAAQSLVRKSYIDPVLTIETNTLGTLNLLDCLRAQSSVQAVVLITSDKCYENAEWLWGYRENDRLGGKDPYSASKACAELITSAYMESFFKEMGPNIATARAGNVIGGGDWASDRIVPDCVRAWSGGKPVVIRNPLATRPWQHVLEPLSGYLTLGQKLYQDSDEVKNQAFNFGPQAKLNQTVAGLIAEMVQNWPGAEYKIQQATDSLKRESTLLKLNCDKALQLLLWNPVLNFKETVSMTGQWYQAFYDKGPSSAAEITSRQIQEYLEKAEKLNLIWTR